MLTLRCPFEKDEAHFSKAACFHELAEDGEIILAKTRAVPLSNRRISRAQKSEYDELPPHPQVVLDLRSSCKLMRRRNLVRKSCAERLSWQMAGQPMSYDCM